MRASIPNQASPVERPDSSKPGQTRARSGGAASVDLVAHSMGGLIARNYISPHGVPRGVAQLLTLGTPIAGTHCTVLPASLGILLPAAIQI